MVRAHRAPEQPDSHLHASLRVPDLLDLLRRPRPDHQRNVTDVSTTGACPVTGVTVRLVRPYGESLGTTSPASDGTYSFGQNATQPGYIVSIEPPATCAAVVGVRRTVSTETSDASATFQVRRIIPQPVSGTVRAGGQPLAG